MNARVGGGIDACVPMLTMHALLSRVLHTRPSRAALGPVCHASQAVCGHSLALPSEGRGSEDGGSEGGGSEGVGSEGGGSEGGGSEGGGSEGRWPNCLRPHRSHCPRPRLGDDDVQRMTLGCSPRPRCLPSWGLVEQRSGCIPALHTCSGEDRGELGLHEARGVRRKWWGVSGAW